MKLALWIHLTISVAITGCADLRYDNTATTFDRPFHASESSLAAIWLKTNYLYPARDHLAFTWLGRLLIGDEAWNVTADGEVPDGPFFTNRDIAAVTPEQAAAGPASEPPPQPPWTIEKRKEKGATPGFIGRDATGRRFLVKMDAPDYPELGTACEIIGSRIFWLLGYHVNAVYLTMIDGTGDAAYDGHRATAALFVPGKVIGEFKLDHYRLRREIRALRLAAAWLNNTDIVDNNTLADFEDGRTVGYIVDFNSCLGFWNGRPKEPWRGWRHVWDVEHQLTTVFTLGLLPPKPPPQRWATPRVPAFDIPPDHSAKEWRPQHPSTPMDRMTPADAAWMARRIAAITHEQLAAIVEAAGFSQPEDAAAILDMLLQRRQAVLDAWPQ